MIQSIPTMKLQIQENGNDKFNKTNNQETIFSFKKLNIIS